jgi:hypothetical protein
MKFVFVAILFVVQASVSIQTDGILSDGEWTGAEQHDIGNGNKVFLKRDNDVLHVALSSANSPFWSHLYLSDGKRIKVMHASAALGSINYEADGSLWRTSDKSFVYELRDREFTPETATKMDSYFSKNGWVSNNVNLGDKKTVEAKINLEGFTPKYFACVVATPEEYYSFPVGLKDHTVLTRLVQGYAVDSLTFEPDLWKKL